MELGICIGNTRCPPPCIMLFFIPKNLPIRFKMARPLLVLYLKLKSAHAYLRKIMTK